MNTRKDNGPMPLKLTPGKMPRDGKWDRGRVAFLCVRVFLGGVFLYAALQKIVSPGDFSRAIDNYRILPDALVNMTAVVLPWIELLTGICLVSGLLLRGAVFLCTLFLLIFFSALIFNMARGLNMDCGCFGSAGQPGEAVSMWWTMARDGTFLCLSVFLFIRVLSGETAREDGHALPLEEDPAAAHRDTEAPDPEETDG